MHPLCRILSLESGWSQSPQIGAAVLPLSDAEFGERLEAVAIPSNRGCCPTFTIETSLKGQRVSRNPLKSGLLSYPIDERRRELVERPKSQSPQIGAAVLPT